MKNILLLVNKFLPFKYEIYTTRGLKSMTLLRHPMIFLRHLMTCYILNIPSNIFKNLCYYCFQKVICSFLEINYMILDINYD